MKLSLHLSGVGEISDAGYSRQEMTMGVPTKVSWGITLKPPFFVRVWHNPNNVLAFTTKDIVFGPFSRNIVIDEFGIWFDGFNNPIPVRQIPIKIPVGKELIIKSGWEISIT